ncbi:MAG: hypothetical protein ABL891_09445 [Burkholderiales bacterium]
MALTLWLGACTSVQQAPSPGTSGASGAAGSTAPRTNANVNLSGYPPAFKDGFSDGCESLRGNYRRDASRFGKDNDYTLGWQDGYSICGRQKR